MRLSIVENLLVAKELISIGIKHNAKVRNQLADFIRRMIAKLGARKFCCRSSLWKPDDFLQNLTKSVTVRISYK